MKWIKKGLLFEPPDNLVWMKTHAAIPCIDCGGGDLRFFFSGRDEKDRAQIGYFDIDLDKPKPNQVVGVSTEPMIALGPLGSFDDNGVTSSWIVNHNEKKYLYYTGWSLGVTVPFYFYIGLAISEDGGRTFQKISHAPILERDNTDPYLTASPCVLIENDVWKMWYVSATRWEISNNRPKHYYLIKYAESSDGIHWNRKGIISIDYKSQDEYAIARPCVLKEHDVYKMWYSYRGNSYRIGYAESKDGLYWERKDNEVGIDVSSEGWDSEMIEYPFVFDHAGERYMLYNGNGYGKSGIGLAVLRNDLHQD